MPHSDRMVTTNILRPPSVIDRLSAEEKREKTVSWRAIAQFLEGYERDVFHSAAPEPQREQNMQLERQYTVKWSLLELMSALSVLTLKCLLTRACSSSAKHKSSHNPISCPLIPIAGRERLIWGRRWTKKMFRIQTHEAPRERKRERLQDFKLHQNTCLMVSSSFLTM